MKASVMGSDERGEGKRKGGGEIRRWDINGRRGEVRWKERM